jgi:hypothetical protein
MFARRDPRGSLRRMRAQGPRTGTRIGITANFAPALPLVVLFLAAGCQEPAYDPLRVNVPPATADVRDGAADDVDVVDSMDPFAANWDPFIDPEAQLVDYEWSLGLSPGAADVHAWTPAGRNTEVRAEGVTLPTGVRIHVNVRGQDVLGARSRIASSNGFVIQPPIVLDPTGEQAPRTLQRWGIAWSFAEPVVCGRFVNGDWWVVGPVDIVAITPPSEVGADGRVRHGAMVNPLPGSAGHGYDSGVPGDAGAGRYVPALDKAAQVGPGGPLRLLPGSSLVCTIGTGNAGDLPQVETCAVLTCLPSPPPTNAFRPPYCGDDKTCRWTTSSLDLSRLGRLESPPGTPPFGEVVDKLERTWIDHVPGFSSRYFHARRNVGDPNRGLPEFVALGALLLQLDAPNDQKQPLVIAMTQLGIDVFGIVQHGGRFRAEGGTGGGRKFPLLFAGTVLADDALLRCARERQHAFAEDVQTFYVEETAPGVVNHGFGGYTRDDLGIAEWGHRHRDDPSLDHKDWLSDPYRRCCTANAWHGYVLAARVMGLVEQWNHPALFDYVDRYMQVEEAGAWTRSFHPWAERMWDRHRKRL